MRLRGGAVDAGQAFARDGAPSFHHLAGNDKLLDSFLRWQGVQCIQQQFFEDHHQPASADLAFDSLLGNCLQRVFGEFQLHIVKVKLLLILLDQRILRLSENLDQSAFVEFMKYAANGQATDKLRNQTKPNQIFRLDCRKRLGMTMTSAFDFGLKAQRLITQPALNHFFEANESAAANDKNDCRINFEEFLMRMFSS